MAKHFYAHGDDPAEERLMIQDGGDNVRAQKVNQKARSED